MTGVRTNLIRLGTFALASGTALAIGTSAGLATAATPSGSSTTAPPAHNARSTRNALPDTLSGIKAKSSELITKRLDSLQAASGKTGKAKGLGAGQDTLTSHLGADVTPLHQLDQTIQGDTTQTQAAHDYSTIFTGFRVYRLVLPASEIAANADRDTSTVIPKLSADVTKAKAYLKPSNQARLQPVIDDLSAQITAATNATNGLAATVLAYTPAQLNANTNLLVPATASDKTARLAVKKAHADLKQIRKILKAGGTTGSDLKAAGLKGKGHHHHHHAGSTTTTTAKPATS